HLFLHANRTPTSELYTLSLHDALPIYQDVQAAQSVNRLTDQLPAMGLFADITRDQKGLSTGLLHPMRRFPGIFLFVQIGNEHIGSFARKSNGHGFSDPRIAAGDQGLPSGEFSASFVSMLPMVRFGVHSLL